PVFHQCRPTQQCHHTVPGGRCSEVFREIFQETPLGTLTVQQLDRPIQAAHTLNTLLLVVSYP
ncbi:hypothetical protein M9458_039684, partial [Cirrhinus mrigala]